MKLLRYLMAFALVWGLSGVAKADDFQMIVIDPNPAPSEVHLITTDDFTVTLSACNADQLDGLSTSLYLGCFTGLNVTGQALTCLQLLIPVFDLNGVQDTAGCGLVSGNINVFPGTPTCGLTSNGLDYYVDFTGGNLPTAPGKKNDGDCDNDGDGGQGHLNADDISCDLKSIFTIAVGVGANCGTQQQCANDVSQIDSGFDSGAGTSAVATPVPEPGSLLLMTTGVFSLGLFGAYRRRRARAVLRA
jgi:hypothetical protein